MMISKVSIGNAGLYSIGASFLEERFQTLNRALVGLLIELLSP